LRKIADPGESTALELDLIGSDGPDQQSL